MELGATVCTPKSPNCTQCPVSSHCKALALSRPAHVTTVSRASVALSVAPAAPEAPPKVEIICIDCSDSDGDVVPGQSGCSLCTSARPAEPGGYPLKAAKKAARQESVIAVVPIVCVSDAAGGSVAHTLLVKRGHKGVLAGQWQPLNVTSVIADAVESEDSADDGACDIGVTPAVVDCVATCTDLLATVGLSATAAEIKLAGSVKHIFSHIHHVSAQRHLYHFINMVSSKCFFCFSLCVSLSMI